MAKITITDKQTGDTHSATEFNTVKESVNALYDEKIGESEVIGTNPVEGYSFDGYSDFPKNVLWEGEPRLERLANGNIIVVYRASTDAYHVGLNGYLACRISTDEGKTWGDEIVVYSDQYDDRNQIVGTAPNGDVVVVFRKYDGSSSVSTGYVISTDNGLTWGVYQELFPQTTSSQPFGNFITRGTDVYFLIQNFATDEIRLYKSTDNFTTTPTYTVAISGAPYSISEPVLIDIANGKSIIYLRNNNSSLGESSFFQYNSTDGINFTFKGPTNMWSDNAYSTRSPLDVKYDSINNELIIVNGERTGNQRVLDGNTELSLGIHIQDADVVFNDHTQYELKHKLPRPIPNDHFLYGYPSILESGDGYLGVLCDITAEDRVDTFNGFNEVASIFSYRINKINNLQQFLNYELESPKMVIQNGYTYGRDYIDYKTAARTRSLVDYVKKENHKPNVLLQHEDLELLDIHSDRWLHFDVDATLTLSEGNISNSKEFQGSAEPGHTITIVSTNDSLNGEPLTTTYEVTSVVGDVAVFGLKKITTGQVVVFGNITKVEV